MCCLHICISGQVFCARILKPRPERKYHGYSLRVKLHRPSAVDFSIPGLSAIEHSVFYTGLAVKLATQLSRVQATVFAVF